MRHVFWCPESLKGQLVTVLPLLLFFFSPKYKITLFVTTVVKPRAFVRYLILVCGGLMRMAPVDSVLVFGPQLVELFGEDLRIWRCWRRCVPEVG